MRVMLNAIVYRKRKTGDKKEGGTKLQGKASGGKETATGKRKTSVVLVEYRKQS
jgi:hypothetical protein